MTQREYVAITLWGEEKSIKAIKKQTGIKEPNIRRILGTGEKQGKFERVARGVYRLSENGKDLIYLHCGDALEILPKLANKGLKADMIFLDIPYKTPALGTGGKKRNRNLHFDLISVKQFERVVQSLKKIIKNDSTPIVYMYSNAPSGIKAMMEYNKVLYVNGFKEVARGNYTKYQKDGITGVKNMRGDVMKPEGIILFTKSGKHNEVDLDFHLVRPRGYQTEKPGEMIRSIIEQTTNQGDTVLDPFAGSGVVGKECRALKRTAHLIEISENAIKNYIIPKIEGRNGE